MKKIYLIGLLLIAGLVSCNEDKWLEEEPFSFYAPENSFSEPFQFHEAVGTLYYFGRRWYNNAYNMGCCTYLWGGAADICFSALAPTHEYNNPTAGITPQWERALRMWKYNYREIFDANVVLGRIDNPDVDWTTAEERNIVEAEARFFRAFAYRNLAMLYGDVPLVTEELKAPKRDFVKAPRADIYDQIFTDLDFAVNNLPDVSEVLDGRLSKEAANFLLAEMYLAAEDYSSAISAATAVIDHPALALMTERFGTRVDEPGDVYWDLFRRGNFRRSEGNTEGIWVFPIDWNSPEASKGSNIGWCHPPAYWQVKDSTGVSLFTGPNHAWGGATIGWLGITPYVENTIWERTGDGDIRNSGHNIFRDIIANNPASVAYGDSIVKSGMIDYQRNANQGNFQWDNGRFWHAIFVKNIAVNNYPAEFLLDPVTGVTLSSARNRFSDTYGMRLAEAYLLRAEAHLMSGNTASAATDINVVRARANAQPVAAGDVDLDYLLDERARELCFEEHRHFVLKRNDVYVERTVAYNPVSSATIQDYHKLLPIPHSEIERNTEAELIQNQGYN